MSRAGVTSAASGALLLLSTYYFSALTGLPTLIALFRPERSTTFASFREFFFTPYLDALALAALNLALAVGAERQGKLFLTAAASAVGGLAARLLIGGYLAPLALFLTSSALGAGASVKALGAKEVLLGSTLPLLLAELAALAATASYFHSGAWTTASVGAILRERLIWAPVEWLSIIALALAAWLSLASFLAGRGVGSAALSKLEPLLSGDPLELDPRLALALGVALTTAFVILPHLPSVNPEFRPVSVDTFYYKRFLDLVSEGGLAAALSEFHMTRPAYLVALYGVWELTGADVILLLDVVHPLVALNLLVISTYYATKRLFGEAAASLAALLTPVSHVVVTFIAGGFQANSAALPLALLLFVVRPAASLLFALSFLVALVHPWTLALYSAAYLLYRWGTEGDDPRKLLSLGAALAAGFAAAEAVDRVIAPASSPAQALVSTTVASLAPYFPWNLLEAVQRWTWGTELNPALLALTPLFPAASLSSAFLALLAPATLVANAPIIHRVLLNTPIYIGAAVVLSKSDRRAATVLMLAMLVRVLEALAGLLPYRIELWERTFV